MWGDDEGPPALCPTCCATPISEEMVMVDEMLMAARHTLIWRAPADDG